MTPPPLPPVLRQISATDALAARKVLVINVTRIGDTLLATPALRAIAAYFPNAMITCLGHPKRVEVLQSIPYLQRIGGVTKTSAQWRGWPSVLRGAGYDWAFVWGEDDALVRYALRKARHVVAPRPQDHALAERLFCAVTVPHFASVHAVALALSVTDAVGIPRKGLGLDAACSAAELGLATQRKSTLLGTLRADGEIAVGMQVASFPTKAYRDWPIQQFSELILRASEREPRLRFFVFGGEADRARCEILRAQHPDIVTVLAGSLSLRETAAMMAQMDAYVGVDTGPTHLFAALGRERAKQPPMVVLYHPSICSALYKPLEYERLWAIDHPAAGPTASKEIGIGEIAVPQVVEALFSALDGSTSGSPGLPAAGVQAPAWPVPTPGE